MIYVVLIAISHILAVFMGINVLVREKREVPLLVKVFIFSETLLSSIVCVIWIATLMSRG